MPAQATAPAAYDDVVFGDYGTVTQDVLSARRPNRLCPVAVAAAGRGPDSQPHAQCRRRAAREQRQRRGYRNGRRMASSAATAMTTFPAMADRTSSSATTAVCRVHHQRPGHHHAPSRREHRLPAGRNRYHHREQQQRLIFSGVRRRHHRRRAPARTSSSATMAVSRASRTPCRPAHGPRRAREQRFPDPHAGTRRVARANRASRAATTESRPASGATWFSAAPAPRYHRRQR